MLREQTLGKVQNPPADIQPAPLSKGVMSKYMEHLRKVGDFLDDDKRAHRKRQESIAVILKELSRKKNEIEERIKGERDEAKRRRLETKLSVVLAQREKGFKALDSLVSNTG